MSSEPELLRPGWSAPDNVRALCSTRLGGVSRAPWDSLNLGDHVGDRLEHVECNRALLARVAGVEASRIAWLNQVHGTDVIEIEASFTGKPKPDADAAYTRTPGMVCAILTADCLPVLLCDCDGTVVGTAHAGWRSLAGGVVENLVEAMDVPPERLMAWLGPAIGPAAFEVGPEVREAFVADDPDADGAFTASGVRPGHYLADIYLLARQRLSRSGVNVISGGGYCTVQDVPRFFSYRRDGRTGRMASLIWLRA